MMKQSSKKNVKKVEKQRIYSTVLQFTPAYKPSQLHPEYTDYDCSIT